MTFRVIAHVSHSLSGSGVSEPVGKGTWKMSAQGKLMWGALGALPPSDSGSLTFFNVIANTALWVYVEGPQWYPSFIRTSYAWSCFVVMDVPWAMEESGVREG